jgi:hypothetical protein
MSDSDPEKTYLYVVEQLEKRRLGILHFVEFPPLDGRVWKLVEIADGDDLQR